MHTFAFACIVVGAAVAGYMARMIVIDRRQRAKVAMLQRGVESLSGGAPVRRDRAA